MLYLFDEDRYDRVKKLDYIGTDAYNGLITWFKSEKEVTIRASDLTKDDVVCYHNSFPDANIIKDILKRHDAEKICMLVCFSGDNDFYKTQEDEHYLQLQKDKFYITLRSFLDSGYQIESLKYGNYTVRNEISVIVNRVFDMLFNAADTDLFDPRKLKKGDLKRLCVLTEQDYDRLLADIADITVEDFRNTITAISKNA